MGINLFSSLGKGLGVSGSPLLISCAVQTIEAENEASKEHYPFYKICFAEFMHTITMCRLACCGRPVFILLNLSLSN